METIKKLIKINIKNNHRTLITTINLKNIKKIKHLYNLLKEEMIKPLESLQIYKKKPTDILDSIPINQISFKDTDLILGNTFNFLIIEFDKITPNILIKTIETVSGGGIIILIINDFEKLKESIFWSRIFKKLFEKNFSIFLDSNFNLKNEIFLPKIEIKNKENYEFSAKTKCQEIFLKKYILLLKNKEYNNEINKELIFLTADRGRGKSTSLGILVSYYIYYKINKIIHLTAPKLENLKTMFFHILETLKKLNFKDSEIKVSYKNKLIYKIEIIKNFYQKIVYINPFEDIEDYPDLIIIDEAAAIPIPNLKKLIKCRNIFLSSTIGGYEGTGKSLNLKFIKNLNNILIKRETLNLSIRYSFNDLTESWINESFLLNINPNPLNYLPALENCKLFFINKKYLFSNLPKTELILKDLYSLFVSSHYKNSPDDLKLLSDNENHLIFCLLFKLNDSNEYKIISSIHVALENSNCLETDGNLIPNVINQHYKIKLGTGLRIVRISVHPKFIRFGYGSKSLHEIKQLFPIISELNNELNINNFSNEESIFISTNNKEIKKINWIGASMGANKEILNFWKKNNFEPIYLKSKPNKITGENSCIVLNNNNNNKITKLFKEKLINKLSFSFKELDTNLIYKLLKDNKEEITKTNLLLFTDYDMQRFKDFNEMFNFPSSIIDLLPNLAKLYFLNLLNISLSFIEEMVLINLGLQHKSIFQCQKELKINELIFCQIIRRIIQIFLNKI